VEGVMKIVAWITSLSTEEMARETPLTIALQNNKRIYKQDVDRVVQLLRSGVCLHEEFKCVCRMDDLNDRVVLVYGHSRGHPSRRGVQSSPLFPKIEVPAWQSIDATTAPSTAAAARLLIQIDMSQEESTDTGIVPPIHSPRAATVDPWMSDYESQMELYPRDKLLRTI